MKISNFYLKISYKLRLLLSFFSLALVILIWVVTYLVIDQKQKHLRYFSNGLTEVQIQYLQSSSYLQKFMLTGFHDPEFYKTGNQKSIDSFISVQQRIITNLSHLKSIPLQNRIDVNKHLDSLSQISRATLITGKKLKQLFLKKGFVDFGTEGKMREQAHWIEDSGKVARVDILQLRRHEKDFIMRGKMMYAQQFFGTLDSLVMGNSTDDRTKKHLVLYKSRFAELVNYTEQLGIFHEVGMVPDAQHFISEFNQVYAVTENISNIEINHLQGTFKTILIIVSTILLCLIIVLSLFFSKYLTT